MSRAHLYILRQTVIAMLFVTVGLTVAIWLSQSLRFIDLIVNRGLSLDTFLYLVLLLLPNFFAIVLPIALFAAVMFTFNKLTIDSELVVLKASGLSDLRLGLPVLLLAVITMLMISSLHLYFTPTAARSFKDLQFAIRNNFSSVLLRAGQFTTITDGLTVFVRERRGEEELFGVLVHDNRDKKKRVTVMAEHGALLRTDEGPRVVMANGNRQEVELGSGKLSLLYFDRYTVDLTGAGEPRRGRWREARERYLHELLHPDPKEVGAENVGRFVALGHERLVSPFYAPAFVLIALVMLLCGEFSRRGQLRRIAAAILLVVAVEAAGLGLRNLAAKTPEIIPLMYVNAILPVIVGTYLLVRPRRRRRRAVGEGAAAHTG